MEKAIKVRGEMPPSSLVPVAFLSAPTGKVERRTWNERLQGLPGLNLDSADCVLQPCGDRKVCVYKEGCPTSPTRCLKRGCDLCSARTEGE